MKATYKITAPDEIEATITVTAPVGQLRKVKELLQQNESHWHWPLASFSKAVTKAIMDADKHFTNSEDREAD